MVRARALMVAAAALATCATLAQTPPAPVCAQLAGTQTIRLADTLWVAVMVDGEAVSFRSQPTLGFLESKVRGDAGCNTYFSQYWRGSGDEIRFLLLGHQLVACQDTTDNDAFLKALNEARSYVIESEKLVLRDEKGTARAVLILLDAPADFPITPLDQPERHPARALGLSQLRFERITEGLSGYFGTAAGVLVVRAPRENAFKLQDGDVIQQLGNVRAFDPIQLKQNMALLAPGATVLIQLIRQKQRLQYTVTLPTAGTTAR
jgi:heat shock protein HslJ